MICPHCNIPMSHLNNGDWFSGSEAYQTYDFLKCKNCDRTAIEFYHTEFIDPEKGFPRPRFSVTPCKFEVIDQDGKWIFRWSFDECQEVLQKSLDNKHLVKKNVKKWYVRHTL